MCLFVLVELCTNNRQWNFLISSTSVIPISLGYTFTHRDNWPEECTTPWCARSTPVTMKDHQDAEDVLIAPHIGSRYLSTSITGSGFLLTQSPVRQIYSENRDTVVSRVSHRLFPNDRIKFCSDEFSVKMTASSLFVMPSHPDYHHELQFNWYIDTSGNIVHCWSTAVMMPWIIGLLYLYPLIARAHLLDISERVFATVIALHSYLKPCIKWLGICSWKFPYTSMCKKLLNFMTHCLAGVREAVVVNSTNVSAMHFEISAI